MAKDFISKETDKVFALCSKIEQKRVAIDWVCPPDEKMALYRELLVLIHDLNATTVKEMATLDMTEFFENIKEV